MTSISERLTAQELSMSDYSSTSDCDSGDFFEEYSSDVSDDDISDFEENGDEDSMDVRDVQDTSGTMDVGSRVRTNIAIRSTTGKRQREEPIEPDGTRKRRRTVTEEGYETYPVESTSGPSEPVQGVPPLGCTEGERKQDQELLVALFGNTTWSTTSDNGHVGTHDELEYRLSCFDELCDNCEPRVSENNLYAAVQYLVPEKDWRQALLEEIKTTYGKDYSYLNYGDFDTVEQWAEDRLESPMNTDEFRLDLVESLASFMKRDIYLIHGKGLMVCSPRLRKASFVPLWLFTWRDEESESLKFSLVNCMEEEQRLNINLPILDTLRQQNTSGGERKTLWSHQRTAVKRIVSGKHIGLSRMSIVMPCGSGKTAVQLATTIELGAQSVLVLLPSLALVGQILREWRQWWKYLKGNQTLPSYICVCSDSSVDSSNEDLSLADLRQEVGENMVTTDVEQVQRFFESHNGFSLKLRPFWTFCTYHSTSVLSEAGCSFDVAIFDEAHKTARARQTQTFYQVALKDEKDGGLDIGTRIFFTATPRHYKVSARNEGEDEPELVYSMDNIEVYGPRIFHMTMSQAVSEKIICPYKVLVVLVDDPDDEIDEDTLVRSTLDGLPGKELALHIGLRKAVEQHPEIRKIFTFHSRVQEARDLSNVEDRWGGELENREKTLLNHSFDFYHVNGTDMNMEQRRRYMKRFERGNRAVLTNARCLTEGVDVPSVDCVAFMGQKRSKVDIVQAAGRAMRRKEGKNTGFVIVPLFLKNVKKREEQEGEGKDEGMANCMEISDVGVNNSGKTEATTSTGVNLADHVTKGGMESVLSVLRGLQEADEELAERLDNIRVEKGRCGGGGGGDRDSGMEEAFEMLNEKVEVICSSTNASISSEDIERVVMVKAAEKLCASWYKYYGLLLKFRELNGHCAVPNDYIVNGHRLGRWVGTQRSVYYNNNLKQEWIKLLDEVGFSWNVLTDRWEKAFSLLKQFRDENNHCNVPLDYSTEGVNVGMWIINQRQMYWTNKMSEERIVELESIGFSWDVIEEQWQTSFDALQQFQNERGHCDVPTKSTKYKKLGYWVTVQRRAYQRNKLSKERVTKLEGIGFSWNRFEDKWQKSFDALKRFQAETGHCLVRNRYIVDDMNLGSWVLSQRTAYRNNTLSKKRFKLLTNIGFIWDAEEYLWRQSYKMLEQYFNEKGHCNVPHRYKQNGILLGRWVDTQRRRRREGIMSEEEENLLENLGLSWVAINTRGTSRLK